MPVEDSASKGTMSRIDDSVPQSARVWNYWLGGKDNYAVDREVGQAFYAEFPGIQDMARQSRHWLARTIHYLAGEAGVRQFLDVGTGLPTVDNTHEVAQRVAPESRIVYVDNDPLVLAHANALLTGTPEGATDYIEADLHDPDRILAEAARTLDLTRPVALMLIGIVGHVADDDTARSIVTRLLAGLPSGSYLTLYDGTDSDEVYVSATERYNSSGGVPYNLRSPERIAEFFTGLELVEPGIVPLTEWRPESSPFPLTDVSAHGGVGRKP